jgi:hypothetical protein
MAGQRGFGASISLYAALAVLIPVLGYPAEPSGGAPTPWQVISTSPYLVKSRAVQGSPVRELWAVAVLDAPTIEIQAAILDTEAFPRFMPHVKEAVVLGPLEPDGSYYSYARTEPPLVAGRDYVLHVFVDSQLTPDGRGEFTSHWQAEPDRVPRRAGMVRLKRNNGSWRVSPAENGKTRVEYRLAVDPGGSVPAFLADMANKVGVEDVMHAIEREARRRAAERAASASPVRSAR